MNLLLEPYEQQRAHWPQSGRHVLAQFDDETVVVYQAYRSEIGHDAVRHGRFGSAFSFSRMSWIKPNFLWMMFRSGWGALKQFATEWIRSIEDASALVASQRRRPRPELLVPRERVYPVGDDLRVLLGM